MSASAIPTPTARRSLAEAFTAEPASAVPAGPTERSAALVGLLPPRTETPASTDVPGPAAARRAPRPNTTRPEPRPRPRAANAPPPSPTATIQAGADDVVRSVAVYLPPPLLHRLRAHARTHDLTYAEVLVAAAVHADTLTGCFDPPAPTAPLGGMPGRARPVRATPGVQTQLRLDGHQVAWLDATAGRTGAPSRSALVVALLDTHLPVAPGSPTT